MRRYTIKAAAELTGTSVPTLRYYEAEGLLGQIDRLPNGHRRYSEQDIAWIEFLVCLRESGMPIQNMKHYVDLCNQRGTGPERCALLENHREVLKEKIAHLNHQLNRLEDKIVWYQQALAEFNGRSNEETA